MVSEMAHRARVAARRLAITSTAMKDAALICMAEDLLAAQDEILAANAADLDAARVSGTSEAMVDRLMLNPARLRSIVADLRHVSDLHDPVGEIFDEVLLPNHMRLYKQRVPLGVIAVIYEARPNVTIDVAGLTLKTGNAAILRGGSETLHSNRILVDVLRRSLESSGLPVDAVQFIDNPDRGLVLELLHMYDNIDMLIPRGGAALHRFCRENSRIPVITGGIGICHLYVDDRADLEASLDVIYNAKVQRPSVCNALDTLLVHRTVAAAFLPQVTAALSRGGVNFRADSSALPYLVQSNGELLPGVSPAGEQDFDTEWLSLVLSLKVVDGLDEAVEHIEHHSTRHSDGILTDNPANAERFLAEVDSAAVYVNASTRFTDGAQFGLGAEVAVSTQRLHARGPMGLQELTTYKWVGIGDYNVRE